MKLEIKKTAKEVYSVILKDVGAYGGFPFYGAVFLAALLIGVLDFAYRIAISLIAVTFIVAAIRLAWFKPRPGALRAPARNVSYYERIDGSAFPSIHAARAVMVSLAIYTKLPVMLPLLVLLTLIVFASRLHFKRHNMTDVTAGAVIGAALGALFFSF